MEEKLLDSVNNNELNTWFKTVTTKEEAKELVVLLDRNAIYCRVSSGGNLDSAMEGDTFAHQFELFVSEDDLERAKSLCLELAQESLSDIDPDYFLFRYSNEELIDILRKRDEWSELDVLLSEKILKDRCVAISEEQLQHEREGILEEAREPEEIKQVWILVAYIFVFLSGFYGSFVGFSIWKATKKLPNGEKRPAYSDKARKHGFNIFVIGVVLFILTAIIRFLQDKDLVEVLVPFYL